MPSISAGSDCLESLKDDLSNPDSGAGLLGDVHLYFHSNSMSEFLHHPGSQSTLKQFIEQLKQVKNLPGATQPIKITAGKEAKRVEDILRWNQLNEFVAGASPSEMIEKEDFVKGELEYLKSRFAADKIPKTFHGNWHGWTAQQLTDAFEASNKHITTLLDLAHGAVDQAVQETVAEAEKVAAQAVLPFDLETATNGQLVSYIKENGGVYVGAMTKDQKKIWVNLHLGISKVGQYANLDKAALESLKQSLQDSAQEKLMAGQAVKAQHKAEKAAEEVKAALPPVPDYPAKPWPEPPDDIPWGSSYTKAQKGAWIKSQGGNYVGAMSDGELDQWIEAHYIGDVNTEFKLEQHGAYKLTPKGHKDKLTHPGSPYAVGKDPGEVAALKAQSGTEEFLLPEAHPYKPWGEEKVWAAGDLPDPEGKWPLPGTPAYQWTEQQSVDYLHAVGYSDDTLTHMNPGVRAQLASSHRNGDQLRVDRITKAASLNLNANFPVGHVAYTPDPKSKQMAEELKAELKAKVPVPPPPEPVFVPPPAPEPAAPVNPVFTKKPNQPALGGMHSKAVYTDQFGNEWLFKPTDEAFRADTEDAALKIGRLLGYTTGDSRVVTLEGKTGVIIKMFTNDVGSFAGTSVKRLTEQQLSEAAQEHVLDWVLANHDTHVENLLRLDDGHVIGIDKGQAFKFFGKDRLAIGYLPPGNGASVWYDQLYTAILHTDLDSDTVDRLTIDVLKRARAVARADDAEFRKLVEQAVARRPTQTMPGGRQLFVDKVVARKQAAYDDFESFYRAMYTTGHRDWGPVERALAEAAKPVTITNVSPVGGVGESFGHIHSGITDQLLKDAERAQIHGVPTFFAGPEFEDMHLLAYEELDTAGGRQLVLEGQMRADGDQKISNWLSKQTVTGTGPTARQAGAPLYAPIQKNDEWWNTILSGAKTVSAHATDGKYNEGTLAQLKALKTQLSALAPSSYLPDGAADYEVQQMKEMLDYYVKQITQIEEAKAQKIMVPQQLEKFTVKPKATLDKLFGGPKKPEPKKPTADELLKVLRGSGNRPAGQLDVDKGILQLTGGDAGGGSGTTYTIKSGNITIDYKPWESGVARGQQGRLRVAVSGYTGSREDVDRAVELLHQIGLPMTPADRDDFELFYWRHLQGVLNDRKLSVAEHKILDAIAADPVLAPESGAPKEALLEHYRKVFAKQVKTDDPNFFMPKLSRVRIQSPEEFSGHPYWWRPDVKPSDLKALLNGNFPASSWTTNASRQDMVKSGGMAATDERVRRLGSWLGGMSSSADAQHGSSNFVFTRLGQQNTHGMDVWYSPEVMLRTSTFSFNSDHYGEISDRASSSRWSPSWWHQLTGGGNETLLKRGASVLDDIEVIKFNSESERQAAIKWIKSQGVTEIRGLSVEDRFATQDTWRSALAKAWEAWSKRNA